MKAKINKKEEVVIYKGEDRTLDFYIYDENTIEPINLTGKTVTLCLKNMDNTNATFAGTVSATTGFVSFVLGNAETVDLKTGRQNPQLEIVDTGLIDIEIFSNFIEVKQPIC